MTDLHLIHGGRDLRDADTTAALAAIPFLPLMRPGPSSSPCAVRQATAAVEQITAAVAILAKGKGELASLIAAAGREQAAEGHAALRHALAGVMVLAARSHLCRGCERLINLEFPALM
jgi:hypothetical protein